MNTNVKEKILTYFYAHRPGLMSFHQEMAKLFPCKITSNFVKHHVYDYINLKPASQVKFIEYIGIQQI